MARICYNLPVSDPAPATDGLSILDSHEGIARELVVSFYDEVLKPLFPPEELIAPWWEDGDGEDPPLLLLVTPEGRVAGGALGEWYPRSRVLLLSYVAARPEWRGRGIGTRLMREIEARWCRHHDFLIVLGEIDDPRHRPDPNQDPWERVSFYERFNGWLVGAPYFQPSIRPSSPRAYHLMLGVLKHAPEALTSEGKMRGEVLRTFLEEYFAACEGKVDGEGDPQMRWLLDSYRDDLELIQLTEIDRVPHDEPPALVEG